MSAYPKFPDSKKKAPNVFFGVYDDGTLKAAPGKLTPQPVVINTKTYPTYFTSVLYPFITDDRLNIPVPAIVRANLLTMPFISGDAVSIRLPLIPLASLISTIVYKSYTWLPEYLSITLPTIAGNLTSVINYISYTWDGSQNSSTNIDKVRISVPAITAGSLITTITYIEAKNWPIEFVTISLPQIVAASLL